MSNKPKDITGNKYGKLTALSLHHRDTHKDKNGKTNTVSYWNCECECGNKCIVRLSQLTTGKTTSCGCFHKERLSIHQYKKVHGDTGSKFHNTYCNIKRRCSDKSNKDYGGRGIICEWNSYDEFKNDMYDSYLEHCKIYGEENTSIDRIDFNGNYCKDNCRWADKSIQANNKRNNIVVIMPDNTEASLTDVSIKTGINRKTLHTRYRNSSYNGTKQIPYNELMRDKRKKMKI